MFLTIESTGNLGEELDNIYTNFPLNKISRKIQTDIQAETVRLGWRNIGKTIKRRIVDRFEHEIYYENKISRFLDEGTTGHRIEPKNKSALHWIVGSQNFFSKGHYVSGIKATNFFKIYPNTLNWITQTTDDFIKNGR